MNRAEVGPIQLCSSRNHFTQPSPNQFLEIPVSSTHLSPLTGAQLCRPRAPTTAMAQESSTPTHACAATGAASNQFDSQPRSDKPTASLARVRRAYPNSIHLGSVCQEAQALLSDCAGTRWSG
jgi:hypothetical protein